MILAGAVPAACLALLVDGGLLLGGAQLVAPAAPSVARARRSRPVSRWSCWQPPWAPPRAHRQGAIRVGSKNFTEQIILGEILAQTIENRTPPPGRAPAEPGRHVHLRPRAALRRHRRLRRVHRHRRHRCLQESRRDRSGARLRARSPALRRGGVDAAAAAGLREHVRYPRPRRRCAPVRAADHRRRCRGSPRRGGQASATSSCSVRDGYPGLAAQYGLRFAGAPRAMDLSLIYRALAQSAGGSHRRRRHQRPDLPPTIWPCSRDNRHYFPPYDAAPVVRRETLLRYPDVRAALERSGRADHDRRHAPPQLCCRRRSDGIRSWWSRDFLARLEREQPA